jgi:hypothetical protein
MSIQGPHILKQSLQINGWKDNPTGKLLEVTLDDVALDIGLGFPWKTGNLAQALAYISKHFW